MHTYPLVYGSRKSITAPSLPLHRVGRDISKRDELVKLAEDLARHEALGVTSAKLADVPSDIAVAMLLQQPHVAAYNSGSNPGADP